MIYFEVICLLNENNCRLISAGFVIINVSFVVLVTAWAALTVVPIFRRRALIMTESGLCLDTLWRRQNWSWGEIVGVWPLGGFKAFLEIISLDTGDTKRVFLGSYWPGDSEGLGQVIGAFRDELG